MKGYSKLRKTKIVCTIGPATANPDKIRDLILAGMDVARLNFSHGDHQAHRKVIQLIRTISEELGRPVGILQDLGGAKIRIGKLPVKEKRLGSGERIALSPIDTKDSSVIHVLYPRIAEDVAVGDRVLMADGMVELKVEEKVSGKVICRVVVPGVLHSNKGINLPSSNLSIQSFTTKDRKDLAVGLQEHVDFVALSFIRSEKDLLEVKELLAQVELPPMLIAKIETAQAVQRLDEIIASVGGVMVARGDLGVEISLEEVPLVQKRIIRMARHAAKPVITATQMLRSMVNSPRPTRAEASDVANAIIDGTDAIMLSEETAIGEYPVEAVRILDRIARATERELGQLSVTHEPESGRLPATESAMSRAAYRTAEELDSAAIVAGTSSGRTPRLVARFRPRCPVAGLTASEHIKRQLTLSWGVVPGLVIPSSDPDQMFLQAAAWVKEQGLAGPGGRVVVLTGVPLGTPGTTNLLKVIELSDL